MKRQRERVKREREREAKEKEREREREEERVKREMVRRIRGPGRVEKVFEGLNKGFGELSYIQ